MKKTYEQPELIVYGNLKEITGGTETSNLPR